MDAIILLGAPGAGKGTVAEQMKVDTDYQHVSTGDMLRAAVKDGTDVGKEAEAYMKRGELVPDAIMIRIVEERLDSDPDDTLYMFDGFPRTETQAELIEESFRRRSGRITNVFFLDTPEEVLIKRLTGRRICRQCGMNYHLINLPPKQDGVCDKCGGELYQRPDDNETTIISRLEVFNKQTEGLIARYTDQGILSRIDSNREAKYIVADVMDVLQS